MHRRRLFSRETVGGQLRKTITDNAGSVVALSAIVGGTFGFVVYIGMAGVFQSRVETAEAKIKTAEEKIKIAEEKINAAKLEARKDVELAERRAEKEALKLLYNIFTQEEFKEAKIKLLAQKDKNADLQ